MGLPVWQVHSCSSPLHDWFKALEAGQEVCSIFFDLKKAFDSVPHRPLLDKLASYGLDVHTLSWITSYLTNRKQHVVVGGETSLFYLVYHRDLCWVHCFSLFTSMMLPTPFYRTEAYSTFMQMTCCYINL